MDPKMVNFFFLVIVIQCFHVGVHLFHTLTCDYGENEKQSTTLLFGNITIFNEFQPLFNRIVLSLLLLKISIN